MGTDMARKSCTLARLIVLGVMAIAMWKLASVVGFVAPPQTGALRQTKHNVADAAVLAAALAATPLPAKAVDQVFDSFGPGELTAITIPIVFFVLLRLEWEEGQDPVDDVTGT